MGVSINASSKWPHEWRLFAEADQNERQGLHAFAFGFARLIAQ